jgi:hypothetical protein
MNLTALRLQLRTAFEEIEDDRQGPTIGHVVAHSRHIENPGLEAILDKTAVEDIHDVPSPEVACPGDQGETDPLGGCDLIGRRS